MFKFHNRAITISSRSRASNFTQRTTTYMSQRRLSSRALPPKPSIMCSSEVDCNPMDLDVYRLDLSKRRPTIWLSCARTMRTWMEFANDDGTFNIDAVAASIEVRPETLIVGKIRPYRGITFAEVKTFVAQADDNYAHHVLGDSEATAVTVDGSPIVEARLMDNPMLQSLQTSLDVLQNSFESLSHLVTSAKTKEFFEFKTLADRVEKLEKDLSSVGVHGSESSSDGPSCPRISISAARDGSGMSPVPSPNRRLSK